MLLQSSSVGLWFFCLPARRKLADSKWRDKTWYICVCRKRKERCSVYLLLFFFTWWNCFQTLYINSATCFKQLCLYSVIYMCSYCLNLITLEYLATSVTDWSLQGLEGVYLIKWFMITQRKLICLMKNSYTKAEYSLYFTKLKHKNNNLTETKHYTNTETFIIFISWNILRTM